MTHAGTAGPYPSPSKVTRAPLTGTPPAVTTPDNSPMRPGAGGGIGGAVGAGGPVVTDGSVGLRGSKSEGRRGSSHAVWRRIAHTVRRTIAVSANRGNRGASLMLPMTPLALDCTRCISAHPLIPSLDCCPGSSSTLLRAPRACGRCLAALPLLRQEGE
jgi:hypothetical protein